MKKLLSIALLAVAFAASCFAAITVFFNASVTNSAVLVSATPSGAIGTFLASYNVGNPNVSTVYLQLYDSATAGAVTVGVTTPKLSLAIPAVGVLDGAVPNIPFTNGIVIAATTTATGGSAPSTAISVNILTQ